MSPSVPTPRPSSTAADTSPFLASIIVGLRCVREATSARTLAMPAAVEQIGLVEHDQIGAGQLILEQLLDRAFVIERCRPRRGGHATASWSSAKRPAATAALSTTVITPSTVTCAADIRPVEGRDQRLRQGQARRSR